MKNCFNCKKAKEKYVSTDEERMLFYCEENEAILIALNYPEYICEAYEYDNIHVNNTARQNTETRDKGIHQEK